MKKLLSLLLALAPALFFSCTQEEDPWTTFLSDYDSTYKSTLKLSRDSVSADCDETRVAVKVTSDYKWYIEIPEEAQTWLSADVMYGLGGGTTKVYFYFTKHEDAQDREATVTFRSGKSKKKMIFSQALPTLVLDEADVQDIDRYYQPKEFSFDMLRSDSKWSWCRSKQSEHVVVFWDKQYGEYGLYGERMGVENTSPSTCSTSAMVVDIDDLLKKAEIYYKVNTETLKFSEPGTGKSSVLDDYKFEIYILYQSEWLATGSGYDNHIGALWVNPSTCKPVGSTIAHEIGHAFQYMTFCDWLKEQGITGDDALYASGNQGPGWRYGFGASGAGGNAFWEQTAQWQSYQTYKSEAFDAYYSQGFFDSIHLHVLHESPRYSNYMIHWWWVENTQDITFIGRMWREAEYPEDPCETYMRLMGYDNAEFNDDIWRYAAHCCTFDMDEIRSEAKASIGKTATTKFKADGDAWRINDQYAPESTGSNAILLSSAAGKTVSAAFEGLYEMTGSTYKCGPKSNAGWRYGFVSYNKDGSTTYSDIFSDPEGTATFEVPSNSSKLWFVVSGAPVKYERHPWPTDDKAETDKYDNKWPWRATFTGTKPNGK